MKKTLSILLVISLIGLTSCGTIYGGRISDCQKYRSPGARREIRPAALVGDIIWFPYISLPIDFITGGIYKPCR